MALVKSGVPLSREGIPAPAPRIVRAARPDLDKSTRLEYLVIAGGDPRLEVDRVRIPIQLQPSNGK